MSVAVLAEIEEATRGMLAERLALLTEKQAALFEKVFPGGVRSDQLVTALDLCDRTIRKNKASEARSIEAAP